ncbi:ester cyclase [Micromonospora chalcea]|uniref:ester cyclase n=1 Tax=Micromonospora chalcea TaxID=1874 RepID=UPI00382054EB
MSATATTATATEAQEIRDFYLRYVDLANKREFDRMADFAHEEVIMNGTPVRMADMVAEFYKHVEAVPDLHWEIQEVVVEGDRIAARLVDTGTPVKEWNGGTHRRLGLVRRDRLLPAPGRQVQVHVVPDGHRLGTAAARRLTRNPANAARPAR